MRTPRQPSEPEGSERLDLDTVRLRRLNRWQAEGLREDLADLYVESSAAEPGEEFQDRQKFLHRLADEVKLPGFDMLVAEAQALTGCVIGIPVPRDGSWWHGFEGPLPQNLEQLTASGHVFAILETVVHPHRHAQGLARRLPGAPAHRPPCLARRHPGGALRPAGGCRPGGVGLAGRGADPAPARTDSPAAHGSSPRGTHGGSSGRPRSQRPYPPARIAVRTGRKRLVRRCGGACGPAAGAGDGPGRRLSPDRGAHGEARTATVPAVASHRRRVTAPAGAGHRRCARNALSRALLGRLRVAPCGRRFRLLSISAPASTASRGD